MRNNKAKNLKETHTNRLLVSAAVSLTLLVILTLVHRGQYSNPLFTMNATLVFSVLLAVVAVALACVCFIKDKKYLVEYIALFAVMAFCFYCVHGVGFVGAKLMKYVTAALLGVYFVLTFIYHTFAPKFKK